MWKTAEHENVQEQRKRGWKVGGLTWTVMESDYGCEGQIDEF